MNYYQEKIEIEFIIPARIYIGKPKGDNCHSSKNTRRILMSRKKIKILSIKKDRN